MTAAPQVVVHHDADTLADAVAARLVVTLVDAQAARGAACVVLTGGGIGTASLRAWNVSPARDAVDWKRLDVWWGDERFLPSGDPERNETGARAALLDHVGLDPARVHPMPASDGPDGPDPDAAAARHAAELSAAASAQARSHGGPLVPSYDVVMLGVGPDGHVASLFPEAPGLYDERTVLAVRGAPKPPPTRLSLSFDAINAAREVWLIAAGAEKSAAVAMALGGAGRRQIPAAGVAGTVATRWLLDRAAAARLPASIWRPASP